MRSHGVYMSVISAMAYMSQEERRRMTLAIRSSLSCDEVAELLCEMGFPVSDWTVLEYRMWLADVEAMTV